MDQLTNQLTREQILQEQYAKQQAREQLSREQYAKQLAESKYCGALGKCPNDVQAQVNQPANQQAVLDTYFASDIEALQEEVKNLKSAIMDRDLELLQLYRRLLRY